MQLGLRPTNTGLSSFYKEKEFQTLFNKPKVVVTTNYLTRFGVLHSSESLILQNTSVL